MHISNKVLSDSSKPLFILEFTGIKKKSVAYISVVPKFVRGHEFNMRLSENSKC